MQNGIVNENAMLPYISHLIVSLKTYRQNEYGKYVKELIEFTCIVCCFKL